jgi:hypothetical protein
VTGPDEPRRVTLVLDTSAVLAYAAGSMHVHEPVLIAGEDGDDVAVPVLCLIEAVRRDPTVDLRELLHLEQVVTMMPDRHADADLLTDWTIFLDGREDAAAAAVLTYRHRAGLLTTEPDMYTVAGRRPDWVIPTDGAW